MNIRNLRIVQLDPNSRSHRNLLVKFPFKVYKGDPYWVPQLVGDRKKFLDPQHNPSFEYIRVAYFAAEAVVLPDSQPKDAPASGMEQVVGTIAAIVNPRHNEANHDHVGFFGLFEVVNNYDVAEALLDAAADWLRGQGCTAIRGPATFTQWDEYGLLVDGFADSPRLLMPYNLPYYPEFVEAWGLEKAMDLYAYEWNLQEQFGGSMESLPPKLLRVVDKLKDRSRLTLRNLDMANYEEEVKKVKAIYDAAWEHNWGAVPITDRELQSVAKQLKQIIDPSLVFFAEVDGKPVGLGLSLLDANLVLKSMGGHLFPFGIFKALYYQRKINWIRVWALGVLPEYRHRGVDAVLYYETVKAALAKGIYHIEGSWILEDNLDMNRVIVNLGGEVYKTYRVYEKEL
jgi:GNAT superfamily N-acetyltransferase